MPYTQPPMALSSAPPNAEATAAQAGTGQAASASDHQHPRLTSVTVQTLLTGGNATVMFTRPFVKKPGIGCTAFKDVDNLPVTFEVSSWIMGGVGNAEYVGCVIHGIKARTLPAVIALLTALVSFNTFQGDATGVEFSCIAVQASN